MWHGCQKRRDAICSRGDGRLDGFCISKGLCLLWRFVVKVGNGDVLGVFCAIAVFCARIWAAESSGKITLGAGACGRGLLFIELPI